MISLFAPLGTKALSTGAYSRRREFPLEWALIEKEHKIILAELLPRKMYYDTPLYGYTLQRRRKV